MTDLQVSVGERNGDGKRAVTYRFDGREYPDTVDVTSGWQREQSLRRALQALGLPSENLSALDAEVAKVAAEADRKAEGKAAAERFPIVSSEALDREDYTPMPIITEALFRGVPAIVGAPFKTCKTLVAIDAAISVATGFSFLGCWTVPTPMHFTLSCGDGRSFAHAARGWLCTTRCVRW